jgi:gas vesicle protein
MDKFLLGLGVGMIGGVLFAPRSGSDTRRFIADKACEGFDQVKSAASEGVDYVKSKSGDLGSMASDLVDKGKSVIGRQADEVRDVADQYQPA